MTNSKLESGVAPIFIGGMFKSGTTLLRAMLGQHSNIAAGLETYWFDLDLSGSDVKASREHVTKTARLFDIDPQAAWAMAERACRAEAFLDAFMAQVAARQGKSRWAEKTPGNIVHIDRIVAFWPRAKVIHILRDPRDVFSSMLEAGKSTSPEDFASVWSRMVPPADPAASEHLLPIRYENLIADTERTMHCVLDFVGEPWEDAVSWFSGSDDEYEKVLRVTGKTSTTLNRMRKPISDDRVGLWRRVIGDEGATALFAAADDMDCGAVMRRIAEETGVDAEAGK